MMVREPVVAGQFYPARADQCRAELLELLTASCDEDQPVATDATLVAGLVPHAGWACSGAVAARVFRVLAASCTPDVIVLFGGVHRYRGSEAALFRSGRWETPLGPVAVDDRLADRILGQTNLIVDDPHAHRDEHSLEVQIPFIKHLFPRAKVVPIMVPIVQRAHEVGDAVARTLTAYDYNALIVGTTDLTHYGPGYRFVPHGVGAKGNAWAKEDNDRRFIDLMCEMKATELVPEAADRRNACNGGAAAATVTAAAKLGATRGLLLQHTTSSEVLAGRFPQGVVDSVGYAAIVFS